MAPCLRLCPRVTEPTYYINGLFRQANAALARAYLGITGGGGFVAANLTEAVSGVLVITGGANAVNGAGTTIQVKQASGVQGGFVSAADFATLSAKLSDAPIDGNQYARKNGAWDVVSATPATGNLTESTSGVLTITGGTGAVVGAGTSIQVQKADTTHSGYLSDTDWNTFNGKQPAGSYLTDAPSSGITYGRLNGAWSAAVAEAPNDGNYYARQSAAWAVIPLTGAFNYYLTATASSVATYLELTAGPYTPKTTLSTGGLTAGDHVLQNFVTNAGIPGQTFLPAGQFEFHVHAAKTGGTKAAALYAEFWECSSVGVDIGKIGTTEVSLAMGGIETEYQLYFVTPAPYIMGSSASRIVCRVFARISGGGADPTVAIYYGDEADSHIGLPSPAIDASNFVPASRTISTTAPITGGGDLSANRTFAISKATSLVDGYLDHTDFATFNGKLSALKAPKTLFLCGAYTPASAGADAVEAELPYATDGSTLTYNVNIFRLRVATAGGAPALALEKSSGTGGFSATSLGTLTLGSGAYEGNITALGTAQSGDKLRFNVGTLGTAQNWTVSVELAAQ